MLDMHCVGKALNLEILTGVGYLMILAGTKILSWPLKNIGISKMSYEKKVSSRVGTLFITLVPKVL